MALSGRVAAARAAAWSRCVCGWGARTAGGGSVVAGGGSRAHLLRPMSTMQVTERRHDAAVGSVPGVVARRKGRILGKDTSWMRLAAAVAAGAGAAGFAACDEASTAGAAGDRKSTAQSHGFEQAPFRERIVGQYENRIRRASAPEKVFEYFASVIPDDDDDVYMTSADFMRAITPYNPYVGGEVGTKNWKYDNKATRGNATPEEREIYKERLRAVCKDKKVTAEEANMLLELRNEFNIDSTAHIQVLRELGFTMRQFDVMLENAGGPPADAFYELIDFDGDGLLSYAEYIFFVTLLATPESKFDVAFKMFDLDRNGSITHNEFARMLDIMRRYSPTGKAVRDATLAGEKGRVKQGGQLKQFFGADRDRKLPYKEFKAYVQKLRHAVRAHEFYQWDKSRTGYLSPYEFAMFLVAYAPGHMLEGLLERAERVKDMEGKVSFDEYVAFHNFLDHLDEMETALDMVASYLPKEARGRTLSLAAPATPDEQSTGGHIVHHHNSVNQSDFRRAAHASVNAELLDDPRWHGTRHKATLGLSELQTTIIFTLFDADGDGTLSDEEFIDVMKARATRGLSDRRDLGIVDALSRARRCLGEAIAHKG